MQFRRLLLLLIVPLLSLPASAHHQNKPTVTPSQPTQKQPPSDITMPLLSSPLRLVDFAGMEPLPSLKSSLTHVSGFIQQTPHDGQRSSEDTEVWMGHTTSVLYFVFVCHDRHPALIRGHLARRENILKDDWVSVLLDPFQDRRKGVMFAVNPAGVQADAAWTENTDPDYSYDQVWDSEARIQSKGWIALIAIPFRSLRFHARNSDWGIVFARNFPRNSEMDY